MPARPGWEGFLKFNLISVPVKAYNATVSGGGKIGFHLLHQKCSSRIRYQKVCPIHGEVSNDEIVSGYEYAKGQYIIIDPEELRKLRTTSDKTISVDAFIKPEAVDPVYFSGRSYYLVPEGKVAQKPYAVLQQVMAQQSVYGIAQVVFSGREQLAVVRPVGKLLTMDLLSFAEQVKPAAEFEDTVQHAEVTGEERKLAETLIEASTEPDLDLTQYRDQYESQLRKLIEAKAKGRKIVAARQPEEPAVINLMDALRQSLEKTSGGGHRRARPNHDKKRGAKRRTAHSTARRRTG